MAFTSPLDGRTREQNLSSFAVHLKGAIRTMINLGPRSLGIDDADEFARETAEIHTYWRTSLPTDRTAPVVQFSLHPARFVNRHWSGAAELEQVIRSKQFAADGNYYPPNVRGTDVMPWGLYNGLYRRPAWALTYSGQFWAALEINSLRSTNVQTRGLNVVESVNSEREIPPEGWIDFPYAVKEIARVFRFAALLASSFHSSEQLVWSATADAIRGTRLGASDHTLSVGISEPCASPRAAKNGIVTAEEFSIHWIDKCADFQFELFEMFYMLGARIARETILKRIGDC